MLRIHEGGNGEKKVENDCFTPNVLILVDVAHFPQIIFISWWMPFTSYMSIYILEYALNFPHTALSYAGACSLHPTSHTTCSYPSECSHVPCPTSCKFVSSLTLSTLHFLNLTVHILVYTLLIPLSKSHIFIS